MGNASKAALIAAALALSAGSAIATGAVQASPPVPAPAAPAAPVAPPGDVAAAWSRYLSAGSATSTGEALAVVDAMYGDDGEPLADCATHFDALERALATVPVSVSLWSAGEACARRVGDADRASRYGRGAEQLAAHALARADGAWTPGGAPIAVVNLSDIHMLVSALGMDVLYRYQDRGRLPRHHRLITVIWDPDAKVERHLAFDFLDIEYRLGTDAPHAGFPYHRRALADAYQEAMHKAGWASAVDLQAMRDAYGIADGPGRVAALRTAAVAGGANALLAWLDTCANLPFDDCGTGLVDALLPAAEQKYALHSLVLAQAYARGVGVKQDIGAAMKLLDATELRWPGYATARFAEDWSFVDKGELPAPVMQRLVAAGAAGNVRALHARAQALLDVRTGDGRYPAPILDALKAAGNAGDGWASLLVAYDYIQTENPEAAVEWLGRGAGHGDAAAGFMLGMSLLDGSGVDRDVAAGMARIARAAADGDDDAMRFMGMVEANHERWAAAESWLISSAIHNNLDGMLALAELYSEPHPGLSPAPGRARQLYESSLEPGKGEARRAFALALLRFEPRDPARARQLLEQDANAGDAQSAALLGRALMRGDLGKADLAAGEAWFAKAIAADPEAADTLAHRLYYGVRTTEARKRALDLERTLADKEEEAAYNNLAWWLCTSEDAAVRNPAEGLAFARRLGKPERMHAGLVDTVAACHAATGDFPAAVALQAEAARDYALVEPEVGREMQRRLDLYKAGKAYVEAREDEDTEA
jgi:TPR repeat protein